MRRASALFRGGRSAPPIARVAGKKEVKDYRSRTETVFGGRLFCRSELARVGKGRMPSAPASRLLHPAYGRLPPTPPPAPSPGAARLYSRRDDSAPSSAALR